MSKHDVCAAGTVKRKLWEAHSKRTAVVREDNDRGAVRSHVCDFVVTLYRHASAPKGENYYDMKTESKSSKVGVSRLCGSINEYICTYTRVKDVFLVAIVLMNFPNGSEFSIKKKLSFKCHNTLDVENISSTWKLNRSIQHVNIQVFKLFLVSKNWL